MYLEDMKLGHDELLTKGLEGKRKKKKNLRS